MGMFQRVMIAAETAMEGHEDQAPAIEARHERGDEPHPLEALLELWALCAPSAPSASSIEVTASACKSGPPSLPPSSGGEVDDEMEIRTMVGDLLERMGFEVMTAVDGLEGLERFQELHGRLALVILDLTMPRMDGSEAFRAARQGAVISQNR